MKALDEIFELLSWERRRYALYYLERADGQVTIAELANKIDEWEHGQPKTALPDDEYDETVLSLEQKHLPKLRHAEHIEYDRENDELRISGVSAELDVILSVTKAIERPSNAEDPVDVDDLF